jgi:branched-chain amino acid transport system ATP-binding protein
MADSPLLELAGVVGGYGEMTILHGVDLAIARGSWTTIIGANGAGKSTLLKLVAGSSRAARGGWSTTGATCRATPRSSG